MTRLLRAVTIAIGLGLLVLPAAGIAVAADDLQDLQARIDATPAGGTLVVDSGVYAAVTIDKPITLSGIDNPVIDAGGDGSAITVAVALELTLETLNSLCLHNTY